MHPMFQCTLDHCGFKVSESEKQSHFDEWHDGKRKTDEPKLAPDGIYECNFSGCEASNSQFNRRSARRHLINHHRCSFYGVWNAIDKAYSTGAVAARGDSFVLQPTSRGLNRPCTYCVKAKQNTRINEEPPNQ